MGQARTIVVQSPPAKFRVLIMEQDAEGRERVVGVTWVNSLSECYRLASERGSGVSASGVKQVPWKD